MLFPVAFCTVRPVLANAQAGGSLTGEQELPKEGPPRVEAGGELARRYLLLESDGNSI